MAMAQQKKLKFRVNNLKLFSIVIFICLILFLLFTKYSFAASPYVLPYPSTMPGSIFYKINLVKEIVLKYWYFGDFGQFTFNLKESDKYIVEAKTLFEYQQYLLGFRALQKSDTFFINTLPNLQSSKAHGKDISENRKILSEAALKHIEVLTQMSKTVPQEFLWQPEKTGSTNLNLRDTINASIALRNKYL
jgi:hypothetical protein